METKESQSFALQVKVPRTSSHCAGHWEAVLEVLNGSSAARKKGPSLVVSLPLLFCPVANPGASFMALHVVPQPSRLPTRGPNRHIHPGEGSGELLTFNGLSASGAISMPSTYP